jgi:hypothetical protein
MIFCDASSREPDGGDPAADAITKAKTDAIELRPQRNCRNEGKQDRQLVDALNFVEISKGLRAEP